ncbi:MAG: hypothetical protein JWO31_1364, partial [Phycisphaerales bacterium]|nr:hypothetical protein [Phycisphaerales bacterium]
ERPYYYDAPTYVYRGGYSYATPRFRDYGSDYPSFSFSYSSGYRNGGYGRYDRGFNYVDRDFRHVDRDYRGYSSYYRR